jgi:hypothetical protein
VPAAALNAIAGLTTAQIINAGLDHAASLGAGHGDVALGGYMSNLGYGATLTAEAQITKAVSAYAQGFAGNDSGINDYGASAGLRVRW